MWRGRRRDGLSCGTGLSEILLSDLPFRLVSAASAVMPGLAEDYDVEVALQLETSLGEHTWLVRLWRIWIVEHMA